LGHNLQKASLAGFIIALGIIYGDIGTSPLYVMNAVCNGKEITDLLIIGSLSCIIWTLTMQTTIKYVVFTLRADNKGEGGIFSLLTLVRRHGKWTVFPAMVGGAALLADGMITPPISVTSAIEGLRRIPAMHDISTMAIVYIVLAIIAMLFFFQQFGTSSIGKAFGPIMTTWFLMLAVLGVRQLILANDWGVFKAFNPYYAIKILVEYPKGFWILGAVFLCTTGAEALYSDLGHCGRLNIRISWPFVKICLILNYLGQGAFLLHQHYNAHWNSATMNPFFEVMPKWFVIPGIVIATVAAIIASQAMISGSFTLISVAIKLNLWPKMKINYPTDERGQIFIPGINMLLFAGCVVITLYFQRSARMEAAYGLAITTTFIMTTILFSYYMFIKRVKIIWIVLFLAVYLTIESSFLFANLVEKFAEGGVVTVLIAGGYSL
jgi:KUP system potassium uptake protein